MIKDIIFDLSITNQLNKNKMNQLRPPMKEASVDFIKDVVLCGGIKYSFTDYEEGVVVDLDYLSTILDDDTMISLTDKIKNLVSDALDQINEEEED